MKVRGETLLFARSVTTEGKPQRGLARSLPSHNVVRGGVFGVWVFLLSFICVHAQYSNTASYELGYGASSGAQVQLYPSGNPLKFIIHNTAAQNKSLYVKSVWQIFIPFPNYLSAPGFNPISITSFSGGETKPLQGAFTNANMGITSAVTSSTLFPVGSTASGTNSVVGNLPFYFTWKGKFQLIDNSNQQVVDEVTFESIANVKVVNKASNYPASLTNVAAAQFTPETIYLAVDGANYYNANNPRPGTEKPKITKEPLSDSKAPNTSHTFSLTATGSNLKYQWYHILSDGDLSSASLMVGQTNPTLTVTSPDGVTSTEESYYCVVSNNAGSVQSQVVTIFVNQPFVTYTYRVTGMNSTGMSSKVYFLSVAGQYEVIVPAFGKIDSTLQTKQAPEGSTIAMDLNGAVLGANTKVPETNVVTAGVHFEFFLDITDWEPEAFPNGNPPPTPQGTVKKEEMKVWDAEGNEQETEIWEYTPYNNTNDPNNTPSTVVHSPDGTYQQIGDQNLSFEIPLGGNSPNDSNEDNGPTAEEIGNAQDNSKYQPQSDGVKDGWMNATPSVGSYNFGSYSTNPNFWKLEFHNPMGMGSNSWVVDLNPHTKPWFTGLAYFIRTVLGWLATVFFIHATWKAFRESFMYSLEASQTQGVDGGALGGTVSLPTGYVYAGIITVAIAAFIPVVSLVLLTAPSLGNGVGFLGLEGVLTFAVASFVSYEAFKEGWILLLMFIPLGHLILLWGQWWINSFLATAYSMAFNVLVRWLVK